VKLFILKNNRKYFLGILSSFVLILILSSLSLNGINNHIENSEKVRDSYEIMLKYDDVQRNIKDILVARRGYIIAGDEFSYNAIKNNINNVYNELDILLESTKNDPYLHDKIKLSVILIKRWMLLINSSAELFNYNKQLDNRQVVITRIGTYFIILSGSLSDEVLAYQKDALAKNLEKRNSSFAFIRDFTIVGNIMAIFVILLSVIGFRKYNHLKLKEIETRKLREEELEISHEKLKVSEEKFRAIFNSFYQFTGLLTPEGILVEANQTSLDFASISIEEVINKPFWDTVWWDIGEEAKNLLKSAVKEAAGGKFVRYETEVKGRNKSRAIIDFSLKPVFDENGKVKLLIPEGRDITAKKKIEEILYQNELKLNHVMDHSPLIVWSADNERKLTMFKGRLLAELGINPEELIGKYLEELTEFISTGITNRINRAYDGEYVSEEIESGSKFFQTAVNPILNKKGKVQGIIGVSLDITDRIQAEKLIKESLKDKETLLKEIHHRVKNNLQIISSLIWTQSQYISEDKSLNMFKDSQNRIQTMARLHNMLYQENNFASVNIADFTKELASDLIAAYSLNPSVKLNIDVESINMDLDKTIPLGLIINELLSNSLKYAFKQDEKGEIYMKIKETVGNIVMTIGDTGTHFPRGFDLMKSGTMGLNLVKSLTKQLKGVIETDFNKKTEFRISFSNN
jgi:PAS domain S-box-containing protein